MSFAMYVNYLFSGVQSGIFSGCKALADPSLCPCYVYKMRTTYDAGREREKKDLDIIIPCVKEIIFNIL